MPRYFFNTRIGDELISDPEGEELRNPDRAWEVARAMIRELLKTEGAEAGLFNAILEVTDDEGEIVLEFPFAEAILDIPDTPVITHCHSGYLAPSFRGASEASEPGISRFGRACGAPRNHVREVSSTTLTAQRYKMASERSFPCKISGVCRLTISLP